MLHRLKFEGVGPAASMDLSPIASRYNLITGDNGLGKSFLLEAAWWVLTRSWHETPAVPNRPDAVIEYSFDDGQHRVNTSAKWRLDAQMWGYSQGRPANPGLVIYARLDGSFSAMDPARNYRIYKRKDGGEAQAPLVYQFSSRQVFEGIRRQISEGGAEREQVICAGLIDDWVRWQHGGQSILDRYYGVPQAGKRRDPLPMSYLEEEAPFIASELKRQGRLRRIPLV